MLSDEEKEALEILKAVGIKCKGICIDEVIINLIEKQQKEIEELKNGQIDFWISDKEIEERIRNKFVSKDKIKAKIEELKDGTYDAKIVLQSLLEKEINNGRNNKRRIRKIL